jgi:autotransporter adhesin
MMGIGADNVAQLNSVAAALGGGTTLDVNGWLSAPTYSIQGSNYYDVGSTFTAIDGTLTSLASRVFTLEQTPGLGLPVGTGNGLALGTGSNATDTTDTAYGAGANVGADSGTAIGSGANIASTATNAVAVGSNSSVTAANGTAIGENASVTANGAVAIGQGSVADQANTVSVGSVGNERRVTNVAAGTAATDAANVGQVQAGDAATLASANTYTDTTATQTLTRANTYTDNHMQALNDQFSDLTDNVNQRLEHQDQRIDKQGAMSAAMLNMAINASNSRSPRGRIGAGLGWQGGEAAMSVGYSKQVGEHASFSIGGAFSGSEQSVGAGFGVDL